MGIRGLTTLIQEDSRKLLPEHMLYDSTVVVDGNNLLHYLYHCCPALNAVFGGDYDRFYVYLTEFCELLAKCKIKPIVVFDGGLDKDNKKSATRWKRLEQRVFASVKVSPANQHRMQVFPLLGKQVLLEVFQSHGIQCLQCEYEADEEIAALARHLQCPVLSNDSDFYIYDVAFIPLESLELAPVLEPNGAVALRCTLFNLEAFLKLYGGMERTLLPLFATIMGNDYVQRSVFETLYSQMSWPKNAHMSDTKRRLKAVMGWLRGQTVPGATEQMINHVKKGDRPLVKGFVEQSIETYTRKPYQLEEDLVGASESLSFEQEPLPVWFRKAYSRSQLPSWLLDILCTHTCPLHAVVEYRGLPNAVQAGRPLLEYISRLLMTVDYPWLNTDPTEGEAARSVVLTLRVRRDIRLVNKTHAVTAKAVPVPQLEQIADLDLAERLSYLKTGLDIENADLMALPSFVRFPVAVLLNCIQHSPVPFRAHFIDAFALAIVRMGVIPSHVGQLKSMQRIENLLKECAAPDLSAVESESKDMDVLLGQTTKMSCLKAAANLHKLFNSEDRLTAKKSTFERQIVHVWSQYQVCYLYGSALNQTLLCPLELTNIAKIFNGTFLYNATLVLKDHPQRRKLIGFWLYQGSVLDQFYALLSDSIRELVKRTCKDMLVEECAEPIIRAPRKKGGKDESAKCEVDVSSEEETAGSEAEESDNEALLGNRFAMLSLGKKR